MTLHEVLLEADLGAGGKAGGVGAGVVVGEGDHGAHGSQVTGTSCSPRSHAAAISAVTWPGRALGQALGAVQMRAEVAVAEAEPRHASVARSISRACQVSPASPHPVSVLMAPARV